MPNTKDPTTSINLVKKVKGEGEEFNDAADIIADSIGRSRQVVLAHHGTRKLPAGKQYMGVLKEYIRNGQFIDSLKEHHPDDADLIEKELRHLYN